MFDGLGFFCIGNEYTVTEQSFCIIPYLMLFFLYVLNCAVF